MEDDIARAENMGIDVTELRRALKEMERRREGQVLSLAVFGSVNTGKSSLVQALTGHADIRKSPASGTTGEVGRYEWTQFGGYRVRLSDVPGRFEYDNPQRAEDAWNEAMGADLIVYVTDADLTREQVEDVEKLAQSGKPLVVTLNKVDLYDEEEIGLILASIRARLVGVPGEPAVAAVHSGGKRKVVTQDAEGRERESWRDIPPDLSELSAHAASLLSHDPERLIGLADTVFIGHLHRRVRESVEERRHELAFGVIDEYSRAAVIASMAAVVPGIEVVLLSGIGVKNGLENQQLVRLSAQRWAHRVAVACHGRAVQRCGQAVAGDRRQHSEGVSGVRHRRWRRAARRGVWSRDPWRGTLLATDSRRAGDVQRGRLFRATSAKHRTTSFERGFRETASHRPEFPSRRSTG